MPSTPLSLSLPGLLLPGEVEPDGVLSTGQIEVNCVLMLKWIVWNRTVFIPVCKQNMYLTELNSFKLNCLYV